MIPNKDELIQLAKWAKGSIHHIYLHHTGGTYEMNVIEKKDYHICIEGDGTVKLMVISMLQKHIPGNVIQVL